MAVSTPFTNPHSPFPDLNSTFQPIPSSQPKSFTYFLCKSLFFFLLLFLLPLFPSEAPDFFDQLLLSKFWELFHLLFVGIAVSYGLFSRRNLQVSVDATCSNFENQPSHFSKMIQLTSIFDDVEDLSASDEKKMNKFWYARESVDDFCNLSSQSCELKNPNCSIAKERYGNSYDFSDADAGHTCKSRYTQAESMVVAAKENYRHCEWGVPKSVVSYKPLGLPVRSLRSNLIETEDVEFDWASESGSCSGSGSKSSSKSSESCGRSEFGNNCSVNLEERFDEAVAVSPSPFQWRSKSVKNVVRERVENFARPSHFRPLSIDETQFESLKNSKSLHSTTSHSSHASSSSSSSTRNHRKMPSLGNISSKSLNSRRFSRSPSEDHLTDRENPSDFAESTRSTPNLEQNFASIPKAASRGKSVRTVRANVVATEESKSQEMSRKKADDNGGKKVEEGEALGMSEEGAEFGWPCFANHVNQNPGNSNRLQKMKFSEMNRQNKEESEIVLADAEDNSESEGENIHGSSDEEPESLRGDGESEAHEVDKKAGEFIAKFRQQIQLQKMASVERSRWGSFSSTSSYFS